MGLFSNPFKSISNAFKKAGRQLEDNIKDMAHNAEESIKKPYETTADNLGVGNLDTDDFLPEGLANLDTDDFIPESFSGPKFDDGGVGDVGDPTGNLTPEEAAAEARKRLSRIGRYFTTVLGDTSKANTGSQRVFS